MKFILSSTGPEISFKTLKEFSVVELTSKKELSAPTPISRSELRARLNEGEEYRLMYKVGCRWEIGAPVSPRDL